MLCALVLCWRGPVNALVPFKLHARRAGSKRVVSTNALMVTRAGNSGLHFCNIASCSGNGLIRWPCCFSAIIWCTGLSGLDCPSVDSF